MEDIRSYRAMPFLKRGMKVQSIHSGKFGRITSANRSMNLNIKMDGEKHSGNYHPQWMMRYFDENNQLIKEYLD